MPIAFVLQIGFGLVASFGDARVGNDVVFTIDATECFRNTEEQLVLLRIVMHGAERQLTANVLVEAVGLNQSSRNQGFRNYGLALVGRQQIIGAVVISAVGLLRLQQKARVVVAQIDDRRDEITLVVDRPGRIAAAIGGAVGIDIDILAIGIAGGEIETSPEIVVGCAETVKRRKVRAAGILETDRILLAAAARNHVQDPGVGEFAVYRRTRAANELDTFDLLHRGIQNGSGRSHRRRVHGFAIQQQLDLGGFEQLTDAAYRDTALAGFVDACNDTG